MTFSQANLIISSQENVDKVPPPTHSSVCHCSLIICRMYFSCFAAAIKSAIYGFTWKKLPQGDTCNLWSSRCRSNVITPFNITTIYRKTCVLSIVDPRWQWRPTSWNHGCSAMMFRTSSIWLSSMPNLLFAKPVARNGWTSCQNLRYCMLAETFPAKKTLQLVLIEKLNYMSARLRQVGVVTEVCS